MAKTEQEKVIKLAHPIMVEGKETGQFNIRRPKLKHLKLMDGVSLGLSGDRVELDRLGSLILTAVEELSDLTPGEVESIDLEDLPAIAGAVFDFFGVSGLIGNKQSGS